MRKTEQNPQKVLNTNLSELALRMALHCVRNTVIEDYHSQGKISDLEMMAINKEVVNNLYTFLQLVLNPKYKKLRTIAFGTESMRGMFYLPDGWNAPMLNDVTLNALRKRLLVPKDTV